MHQLELDRQQGPQRGALGRLERWCEAAQLGELAVSARVHQQGRSSMGEEHQDKPT